MTITIGDSVALKQPPIIGTVDDTVFDRESGELRHLVTYTDANGDKQQRWFFAGEIIKEAE